jgi:hypothetical protein
LPGQPAGIALFDHGAKLLVSLLDRNGVVTVTTRTGKVGPPVEFPQPSSGANIGGPLVVDPEEGLAFVGNLGRDLSGPAPIINVVNLKTMTAEEPISLGSQPDVIPGAVIDDWATADLAVSNTGDLVFVAGLQGVATINVPGRTAAPRVPNTRLASNVVTSLNGGTVYAARGFSGNIVISMPYLGTSASNVTKLGSAIGGMAVGMR